VIFILGGFWLHPVSFFITGLLLLAGAQYEYYLMLRNSGVPVQMVNGIITGAVLYIASTLIAAGFVPFKYLAIIIVPVFFIMVSELYRRKERPFDSLAHTLFALVYVGVPFSLIPLAAFGRTGLGSLIRQETVIFSPGIIIGFLLLQWANDTGAYLTGMAIGKHRLMERISPKKSWEGFFGGMITSVLTGWLLSGWLGVVDTRGWIIISLIISVAGTYGDLVESMLKRSMGVKDSGTIMPGHGGFLDRFDSALLSFPLVYLFLTLFG
jgi:phosphatidate cytidylyltransferase